LNFFECSNAKTQKRKANAKQTPSGMGGASSRRAETAVVAAKAETESESLRQRSVARVSFAASAKEHCGLSAASRAFDDLVFCFFDARLGSLLALPLPPSLPVPELPPLPGASLSVLVISASSAYSPSSLAALTATAHSRARPADVQVAATFVLQHAALGAGCPLRLRALLRLAEGLYIRLLEELLLNLLNQEDNLDNQDNQDEQGERAVRVPVLPGGGGRCAQLGAEHLPGVRQLVMLMRHAVLAAASAPPPAPPPPFPAFPPSSLSPVLCLSVYPFPCPTQTPSPSTI